MPFSDFGAEASDPFALARGLLRTRQQQQSFGGFDPTFGGILGRLPNQRQTGENAQDYPPTEQEEQDLQSQGLLGNVMGGVAAVGNVLDAPGSAIRGGIHGLLTGDFSGTTEGFLDPSKRKYGSDLLTDIGVPEAPKEWSGENYGFNLDNAGKLARGIAGFGVDVVTDPLSMLGILPKTGQGLAKAAEAQRAFKEAGLAAKAGDLSKLTAAQTAGNLGFGAATSPYHVAQEVSQGDRALAGIHLPFWTKWFGADTETPLLAGNLGLGAEGAGKLMMGLGYNPATRLVRGAMSSSASPEVSRFEKGAQIANDMKTVEMARQVEAVKTMAPFFEDAQGKLAEQYEQIAQHFLANGDQKTFQEFARSMQTDRALQEANSIHKELQGMIDPLGTAPDPSLLNSFAGGMGMFRSNLRAMQDNAWDALKKVGGDRADLEDAYALHSARFSNVMRENKWDEARANRPRFGGQRSGTIARADAVRHVPQSEFLINRMAQDAPFLGYDLAGKDLSEADHLAALGGMTGTQEFVNGVKNPLYNVADMQHEYVKKLVNEGLKAEWLDPATGQLRTMIDPATGQTVPLKRLINAGTSQERPFDFASEIQRWNAPRSADHPIDNLVHWLNGLPPKVLENGVYDQSLVKDAVDYVGDLAGRTATLKSAHDYLRQPGILGNTFKDAAGQEIGVPLRDAWGQGWNAKAGRGLNPAGLRAFVEDRYANEVGADAVIDGLKIHPRAAKGLDAYADMANNTGPNSFMRRVDDFKRSLQSWLYSAWPKSHIRDFVSHSWNAASDGKAPFIDILDKSFAYGKHLTTGSPLDAKLAEHFNLFKGQGGDKLAAGPYQSLVAGTTPQGPLGIARPLRGMASLGGIIGGGMTMASASDQDTPEVRAAKLAAGIGMMGAGAWGAHRTPGGFGLSGLIKHDPLAGLSSEAMEATAKAGGKTKIWGPMQAGQDIQHVSSQARMAGYFSALLDKGYTPAQAMFNVKAVSYVGDKLSPFEKTVLSRIVPFERFASRNLPYQVAGLIREPGGIKAQTVRALNESSSQQQPGVYTPEFLREQQRVPVGGTPEAQHFWGNTLIPLNEMNDVVIKPGMTLGDTIKQSVGRTAENFAARLHPGIVLPYEQFADKELHTGRKISDLQSPTGMPWLDSALHYSPMSRVATETESAADPRKNAAQVAMNTLGLGSISTYDTEKWKSLDERAALEQKAKQGGAVPWTNFELPQRVAAHMTPEQIEAIHVLLRRREGLIKWSKQHAQQMKQQQQQQQQQAAGAQAQPTL